MIKSKTISRELALLALGQISDKESKDIKYITYNLGLVHKSGLKVGISIKENEPLLSSGFKLKTKKDDIEYNFDLSAKTDFEDNNIRRKLNFGHTIGHALESISNFKLSHGEAVFLGMKAALYISQQAGNLSNEQFIEAEDLINRFNIKMPQQISLDEILYNLNLLGIRETDIYGNDTLEELMIWLENSREAIGHSFKFYQSNHEGEIIDILHDERLWAQGILINAGAYAHYSYAIHDAIKAINKPTIEIL